MLKTTGSSIALACKVDNNEVIGGSGTGAENGRSSNKKRLNSLSILESTTVLSNWLMPTDLLDYPSHLQVLLFFSTRSRTDLFGFVSIIEVLIISQSITNIRCFWLTTCALPWPYQVFYLAGLDKRISSNANLRRVSIFGVKVSILTRSSLSRAWCGIMSWNKAAIKPADQTKRRVDQTTAKTLQLSKPQRAKGRRFRLTYLVARAMGKYAVKVLGGRKVRLAYSVVYTDGSCHKISEGKRHWKEQSFWFVFDWII